MNSFPLMNYISDATASTDEWKSIVKYRKKQQITFNCRNGTLRVEVNCVDRHLYFQFSISKQMKAGRTISRFPQIQHKQARIHTP